MAELLDFIAEQPIDVINKTELLSNKTFIPVDIDASDFYKTFITNISTINLTHEKAIYVASKVKSTNKKSHTSRDMLIQLSYKK